MPDSDPLFRLGSFQRRLERLDRVQHAGQCQSCDISTVRVIHDNEPPMAPPQHEIRLSLAIVRQIVTDAAGLIF